MGRLALAGLACLGLQLVSGVTLWAEQADSQLRQDATQALRKAAAFYHDRVASHGGYVYYYSEDLQQRWGEGEATSDTIFVQPPGTPTVGMAFLRAYEATGDKFFLDAAQEAAEALVYGQLQSGGWTQTIHFGPAKRLGKYRRGHGGSWNNSSLDDGQTQAALQMLMLADRALKSQHADIHEAVTFGLASLLGRTIPERCVSAGVVRNRCTAARSKSQLPDGRLANRGPHQGLLGLLHAE